MKKFLLSIFAVMLAVFSVQAEEKTGTITFKTSGSDSGTAATTSNFVSGQVTENGGFTLTCTATSYCYTGKSGLKMSSSSKNGTFTLGLGGTYNVKSITVNALRWKSSEAATISVNSSSAKSLTDTAADYVFEVNSEISQIKLDVTKRVYICSVTIIYEVAGEGGETPETPVAPAAPTLPEACYFDDAMTVEITDVAEGATAYYSLNNETDWVEGSSVDITETTTVYAKVVKDGLSSTVVNETYTKNTPVTPPAEGDYVIDELTHSWAGITGTNYSDWSGKKATSSAVYAGNSAGGNSSIQLRSNNSNSGIVTTKSGGKAKKIVVEWNNATSDRTLDVYGKNSAYSAATDLYSASTQGTKLGSIVCGTSTELVIDGDYEYIGLRSNSGAMYLTSISISWDASNVVVVPDAPMLPTGGDFVTSKNIEITNFNDYENGTTVYYSINGGEPMVYTAAFDITTTCEIVAYAEQDGKKSAEVRAEYTRIAKDPVIKIVGDTNADAFEGSIEVEIETENGAVAYYTLNGEDPTVGSTEYEGALIIKATATLKVIAVEEGEYRSKNVVDKAFTMALNDTSVDVDANSATFDASEQNYNNGAAITSVTIVEGITATFGKGSNNNNSPMYYSTGSAIRCYGGNNFTIESTVGTIIKIVLTYGSSDGSNAITTDCGEFNSDTWVGNAESVKFTISGTSGNRRIQKITVTYGEPKNENYSLIVTSAGWATLFLDYAVAIPEGVTCYTVSAVDGEYATLAEVKGVIPANTGVIVEAEEGEYVFEVTDASTEVESNMLGTTVNKYIFEDAYVLGVDEGVVGLYKAAMAGGAWLNNANKAYLPASAVPNKSAAFYGFDWDGTTGIDEITDNRVQSTVIYDLTGRRVEEVTAPGIYIVNGKKVLVK